MSWKSNRLRVWRAERRLTQRKLAKRVRISQGTYSLWESAEIEPTPAQKQALAKALKVTVDDIEPGRLERAL